MRTFCQSAVVLLRTPIGLQALCAALSDFKVAKTIPASGEKNWMGGYPAAIVEMNAVNNGYVSVDAVDARWPDLMGDPKKDPQLMGAWAMGWFGPHVFPGNLERATQHNYDWKDAPKVVAQHTAFIRIKLSYVLGADDDMTILPKDFDERTDPPKELHFVTEIARALLKIPEALVYFNPNGETLHNRQQLEENISFHASHDLIPLPNWSNVRMFDVGEGWMLMDSVGMDQFYVRDHEACFRSEVYDCNDVARFLRNSTDYAREKGEVILHRDTMDGPGDIRWQAFHCTESISSRPRETLRWFPLDDVEPSELLLKSIKEG